MMRVGIAADHGGFTLKGQVAEMTHSATSARATEHSNHGVITSVRGSVVDVRFDDRLAAHLLVAATRGRKRGSPSRC